MDQMDAGRDWWTPDGWLAGTRPEQPACYREAQGAAAQGGLEEELYQPFYPAIGFAHDRLVRDAMRSGICISLFQAPQHVSMMAS